MWPTAKHLPSTPFPRIVIVATINLIHLSTDARNRTAARVRGGGVTVGGAKSPLVAAEMLGLVIGQTKQCECEKFLGYNCWFSSSCLENHCNTGLDDHGVGEGQSSAIKLVWVPIPKPYGCMMVKKHDGVIISPIWVIPKMIIFHQNTACCWQSCKLYPSSKRTLSWIFIFTGWFWLFSGYYLISHWRKI